MLSNEGVIDGRVHTKNRAMRLLNQAKIGKEATLQFISGHKRYDKLGLTRIFYKRKLQEDEFFDAEPYKEVNKPKKTTRTEKATKTTTKKD